MKKIITHSGTFHADDVFAMAALRLYFGTEELEIVRTRDEEVIKTGDWVFDVGGIYDPATFRFDHHQPNGPARNNGVPYAAFGLVWKEIGEQVASSREVAEKIEENLALPIDAGDNGVSIYTLNELEVSPFEIQAALKKLNPVWGSDESYDEQFIKAVDIAEVILVRCIKHAKAKLQMAEMVEQGYQAAEDKTVLVFDKLAPAGLCVQYPEVKATVFPDDPRLSNNWMVSAVPIAETGFETRFRFPEEWGGLRGAELAEVSGVADAVFCHRNGHLLITGSKDTALAAAKQFAS